MSAAVAALASTASVCSPSSGARRRGSSGVADILMGVPIVRSAAQHRMIHVDRHLASARLRRIERLGVVENRAARDAAASRRASHSARVAVAVSRSIGRGERLTMRHPRGVVEEARVGQPLGMPEQRASFSNVRWFAAPTVM